MLKKGIPTAKHNMKVTCVSFRSIMTNLNKIAVRLVECFCGATEEHQWQQSRQPPLPRPSFDKCKKIIYNPGLLLQ
eukprot:4975241-Amphidinium_carterae.1